MWSLDSIEKINIKYENEIDKNQDFAIMKPASISF
jgi:hypothetical protein